MTLTYKIVRYFQNHKNRTIKKGVTLSEAQAWCCKPDTNSETVRSARMIRYSLYYGPWFDGYEVCD